MHLLFRDQSILVTELVYEKSFPTVHLAAFLAWSE
jgi:hypothetical protein